jgi:hypothetical protein
VIPLPSNRHLVRSERGDAWGIGGIFPFALIE